MAHTIHISAIDWVPSLNAPTQAGVSVKNAGGDGVHTFSLTLPNVGASVARYAPLFEATIQRMVHLQFV